MGIPASPILSLKEMEVHPHYLAREVYTEWEDKKYGKMKGVNIIPKVMNNPGEIWRSAPLWGEDTHDIMVELGYDEETIAALDADYVIHCYKPE